MTDGTKLDKNALNTLFLEARSYNGWLAQDVPVSLLHQIHDLARMGPTAANSCPMRVVFVKSKEAKEKLKPFLDKGNQEKTMAAPVVALFAMDRKFYDHLPKLFPHTDAKSWFEGKPDKIEDTMVRNATLQAAYFMLAARSLGLDCGPMSGFKKAGVKEAFFPDLDGEVNFICSLGYGDKAAIFPRLPRFEFDEVCGIV
ncbi:MAG: malonic semialdehyde reductase [Micavibrio aeruginosavorus]|uniref:Putative NADH dehydrogenase/NAD(P)H nitroreductase DI551_07130 n=1 Tax=Micavibrio aeruginosavorus TaxID=349221 RepID=A0A2W5MXK3_9BACT|nr:MAG: malonic semialdehyde reductase [Micavibrio aeruginosavorus]